MLKFEPPLTAVCRLSSKFILGIDSDMLIRVYRFSPNSVPEPTYELVAAEKCEVLIDMITETTRDLLYVEKITLLQRGQLLFVTGGSKNLVLATLRNKGDYEKLDEQEKEKMYTERENEDQIDIN